MTSLSKEELAREMAIRAIRALARVALKGNDVALEVIREYGEDIRKWAWIPEVKELIDKGLVGSSKADRRL